MGCDLYQTNIQFPKDDGYRLRHEKPLIQLLQEIKLMKLLLSTLLSFFDFRNIQYLEKYHFHG